MNWTWCRLFLGGEGIRFSDLPPEYIAHSRFGVKLVVIGKVREFGEGCACPFNFLTKVLLENLIIPEKVFMIVDTDAGVEHVGRG